MTRQQTDPTSASLSASLSAQQVADWIERRSDEIASAAAKAIWHEVDSYRQHADLTLFSELEVHSRQMLGVYVAVLREGRPPQRSDFPWTQRYASRRVSLSIGLPDFLKAFRIGQIALWESITSAIDIGALPADSAALAFSQLLRVAEAGSSLAAETFLEAQQHQLADSAQLERDLLEDLLAGSPPALAERQLALQQVGLGADVSLVVAVAVVSNIDQPTPSIRQRVGNVLSRTGRGLIVSRHEEVIALLPVSGGGESRVVESIRSATMSLVSSGVGMRVGVSAVHVGHESVPGAYDEALLARKSLPGAGCRVMSEMSTLDLLIHSQDRTARLVPPRVRAFIEDDLVWRVVSDFTV